MNLKKSLAIALLALPIAAIANCQFPAYQASYSLHVHGMHVGTENQVLSVNAGHYQMKNVTHAHFMFFKDKVTEQSKGMVVKNLFLPTEYSIADTKKNQPVTISFNDKTHQATVLHDKKSVVLKTPVHTLDNITFTLNLRSDLLAGRNSLTYSVLTQNKKHKAQVAKFAFTETTGKTLDTPLGKLQTVEASRYDTLDKVTEHYWFAPKLGYLLVQSIVKQKSKVLAESQILSYKPSTSCAI